MHGRTRMGPASPIPAGASALDQAAVQRWAGWIAWASGRTREPAAPLGEAPSRTLAAPWSGRRHATLLRGPVDMPEPRGSASEDRVLFVLVFLAPGSGRASAAAACPASPRR